MPSYLASVIQSIGFIQRSFWLLQKAVLVELLSGKRDARRRRHVVPFQLRDSLGAGVGVDR